VNWYDLRDPNSRELDDLAARYHLHPLHIEDCRHRHQRAKVEEGADYLFIVLKPVHISKEGDVKITELDIFLGADYVISVEEGSCPTLRDHLEELHSKMPKDIRPDQLFYRIADGVVDGYAPALDWFSDTIDDIEDSVLEDPSPVMLEKIFDSKRGLVALRRALGNMRDVASHLQRIESNLIQRDLWPFLRDLYDHLARNMDLTESQRDLLTGSMDVYLSSVANRTNQVMKVLTILGTIALPSIVISGFFGMNTKDLPFMESPHATELVVVLMIAATVTLLWVLKKFRWF
jgi:magnesium transporter